MENAADALKMAAAILIFIIAIASSFSLFGTAKQTADSIIGMRDKQKYLEAVDLDKGILYTSSSEIQGTTPLTDDSRKEASSISGLTKNGDRIVGVDDVIATIYRYNKEKYGVTIVYGIGQIIARFDSNTEDIIRQYNNIISTSEGRSAWEKYKQKVFNNIDTVYCDVISGTDYDLEDVYKIKYEEDAYGISRVKCGAPWYGNDAEIQKRINVDIYGGTYSYNKQIYEGKGLYHILKNASRIIEVTNEIDQSDYLKEDIDGDGNLDDTNLLQQYKMPTVEIVYIIY